MKMMKTGAGLMVAFLLIFGLLACSGAQSNSKLVGKWADKDGDVYEFTKTKVISGPMETEYKIENGAIKVSWMGGIMTLADSFEFTDNDTLKMNGGVWEGTYKRRK